MALCCAEARWRVCISYRSRPEARFVYGEVPLFDYWETEGTVIVA